MFRPRSDRHRALVTCLGLVLVGSIGLGVFTATAQAQDRTAAWLESRGLDELLAQHFERKLEAAKGDRNERERIAGRLARAYSRLLRKESDDARRSAIVARANRIIDIVPEQDAGELRVALVRNRYVRASQVMEDDRIAIAEPKDVQQAIDELEAIAAELDGVRTLALRQAREATRGNDRRSGDLVDDHLELAARAGLVQGWSLYYLGRSSGSRDRYETARTALGAALMTEGDVPDYDDVSFDLQAADGFANAMLALAMVTSAADSPRVAAKWFDRLAMPVTHDSVRTATPGWRLAALIDARDFIEAEQRFDDLVEEARRSGPTMLPVAWMRLAAVGGLRQASTDPAAGSLAETAIAALAARGELGQVRSLAQEFGLDALGEQGFIFSFVRGLELHREATEFKDTGDLVSASRAFEESVQLLRTAVSSQDASEFPEAVGGAAMLIGWNLFELDRPGEAADAFEEAASRMAGTPRADAIWGAIVALDRSVAQGVAGSAARRQAMINEFVDAFPADDRSPSLLIRRIAEQQDPDEDDLAVLLQVPESHSTWETARRAAVQKLYREFREAKGDARAIAGHRMLDVADELLERDRDGAAFFNDSRHLDAVLLRQAAEVASDEEVHDPDRANRLLDQIEEGLARGAFDDVPDLPNEIQYRRLGVAIGDQDFEYAARLLAEMPVAADTPEADRWVRLGALRVHRGTDALLAAGPVSFEVAKACATTGARYLAAIQAEKLAEESSDGSGEGAEPDRFGVLDEERLLPIGLSTAAAFERAYQLGGDLEDGQEALAWNAAILQRRPRDATALVAVGTLSEKFEEMDAALDAWRRLARAAPDGSQLWWEAKVGQIRVLSTNDPTDARAVFDQVRSLYPDLGSDAWRDTLQELDRRIDIALQSGRNAAGGDS